MLIFYSIFFFVLLFVVLLLYSSIAAQKLNILVGFCVNRLSLSEIKFTWLTGRHLRSFLRLKLFVEKNCVLKDRNSSDASELSMSFDEWYVTLSPPMKKRFGIGRYIVWNNKTPGFCLFPQVSTISTTKPKRNYKFFLKHFLLTTGLNFIGWRPK